MPQIEGLDKLFLKLEKLEQQTSGKVLAQSLKEATKKSFLEIKAAAPVGSKAHRTYLGRLVAPGFLKKSVKHSARANKKTGGANVSIRAFDGIGRKNEAFYGSFLDRGTKRITARRWFKDVFFRNAKDIERDFAKAIKKRVDKL